MRYRKFSGIARITQTRLFALIRAMPENLHFNPHKFDCNLTAFATLHETAKMQKTQKA
jgi:hypothetical protein